MSAGGNARGAGNTSEDREPSPGGSYRDADALTWGLVLGVVCLVVLPVVVGWAAARPAAAHRWAWRRSAWRGKRGLVTAWAALVLGSLALGTLPADLPEAFSALKGGAALSHLPLVLAWWVVLIPAGWLTFRWRLSSIATDLRTGALPPHTAHRVRRAIWQAADADAYARTGWTLREGAPIPALPRRLPRYAGKGVADRPQVSRPVLGALVDTERRDLLTRWADSTGRRSAAGHPWTRGPWLVLPEAPPRVVVLGDSGSGKTTALRALTLGALREGWRVLYLDGKGAPEDAADLVGLARGLGLAWVEYPRDRFDLWRGDAETVARMAAALLPHDGAQHYRDRDAGALAAVAHAGPWRSTSDLLARLRAPARYVRRDDLPGLLARSEGVPSHMATYAAVAAALAPLAGVEGPDGWGLDDADGWRLAVASLDAGANPAAPVMGAAMLAALDAYRVARRTADARPLLVVVDEAGVFLDSPAAPPAARLAEQLRAAGIGLVLAGQSPHSLGEQADRILSSGAALVTLRTGEPEAVCQRIGTDRAPEVAHQSSGGILTGVTAAREQAQYALDPDRVRTLPAWRVCVWQPGWAVAHAVIPPVEHPRAPGALA